MELNHTKNILSTEELLLRLREVKWEPVIKQLHYYSLNRLKRFPLLAERFDIISLANFFADEAIRQLWMQERIWNTDKYPDVAKFLKAAVDSIRSNYLKSKKVVSTTYIDEMMEETTAETGDGPEAQLVVKEIEEQIRIIFTDDQEALQVFHCIKDNLPPRIISEELDIPIKQVYNAIKRIDRKLTELRKQLSN